MSAAVLARLAAIFLTIAVGWVAARARWLGGPGHEPAVVLSNATFVVFVPALLFRTMARLDLQAMPWRALAAYFVPVLLCAALVYLEQARRRARRAFAPEVPAARTVSAVYGNGVQLGLPMASALFGERGLALHVALVSMHGLVLLTLMTALAELDRARHAPRSTLAATIATTVRRAVVHPIVLPVLAGLAWNLARLPLPAALDEALAALGAAVVPLCLVLIGVSLAAYGLRAGWRGALALGAVKLVLLPALVLAVAHWGFGLAGQSLAVLVMMAALPTGSNALIFAQRYRVLEAEASATIVLSTLAFIVSAAGWLALLARFGGLGSA